MDDYNNNVRGLAKSHNNNNSSNNQSNNIGYAKSDFTHNNANINSTDQIVSVVLNFRFWTLWKRSLNKEAARLQEVIYLLSLNED